MPRSGAAGPALRLLLAEHQVYHLVVAAVARDIRAASCGHPDESACVRPVRGVTLPGPPTSECRRDGASTGIGNDADDSDEVARPDCSSGGRSSWRPCSGCRGPAGARTPSRTPALAEVRYKGKPTAHWVKRLQEKDPAAQPRGHASPGRHRAGAAPAGPPCCSGSTTTTPPSARPPWTRWPASARPPRTPSRCWSGVGGQGRHLPRQGDPSLDAIGAADDAIVARAGQRTDRPRPARRSGDQPRSPSSDAAPPRRPRCPS